MIEFEYVGVRLSNGSWIAGKMYRVSVFSLDAALLLRRQLLMLYVALSGLK